MEDPTTARTAVVIEDDEDIRTLLVATLTQAGFDVAAASNGAEGVELVRARQPIVTTLDVSLPDIDGFEVARRVRIFSETYIVMLTARSEEIDTLMGLDAGADDYLTKHFRPRELRARIQAMLRRPRNIARPGASTQPGVSQPSTASLPADVPQGSASRAGAHHAADVRTHNGLEVDIPGRRVHMDDERIHLTRSEFDLVAALIENPRRVLSKAELVRRLWGEEYATGALVTDADKRTVEVHIANLRRKLREDATDPRYIETVRGVGYRLTPPQP